MLLGVFVASVISRKLLITFGTCILESWVVLFHMNVVLSRASECILTHWAFNCLHFFFFLLIPKYVMPKHLFSVVIVLSGFFCCFSSSLSYSELLSVSYSDGRGEGLVITFPIGSFSFKSVGAALHDLLPSSSILSSSHCSLITS